MKITKLVHSCLVIEHNGRKMLVDPGVYSWKSGIVNSSHLSELDAVVVTHAHPDHLNQDFAEAIKSSSPSARWYGPEQVVSQLKEWGINGSSQGASGIQFVESEHTELSPWFDQQPEHSSFILFSEVLVGGDCHTLTDGHGARIFAGAINGGPWGSVLGFVRMIETMKNRPQLVIPMHDWHWNEEARQGIYAQLPDVLEKFDVEFVVLDNGISKNV